MVSFFSSNAPVIVHACYLYNMYACVYPYDTQSVSPCINIIIIHATSMQIHLLLIALYMLTEAVNLQYICVFGLSTHV